MPAEKKLFNFGVPWEHNISFSQGVWVPRWAIDFAVGSGKHRR